jgi:hypothetical protein
MLFAIFGVTYFKGKFFYCDTQWLDFEIDPSLIINRQDCLNIGGEWRNKDAHFDNILNAMMTLFELATTEGWIQIMYSGIDAVDVDYQPQKNHSMGWALFFIVFIIFGSLFIMNLFVGVVIKTFSYEKEKLGGSLLLTPLQKEWVAMQKLTMHEKPLLEVILVCFFA